MPHTQEQAMGYSTTLSNQCVGRRGRIHPHTCTHVHMYTTHVHVHRNYTPHTLFLYSHLLWHRNVCVGGCGEGQRNIKGQLYCSEWHGHYMYTCTRVHEMHTTHTIVPQSSVVAQQCVCEDMQRVQGTT